MSLDTHVAILSAVVATSFFAVTLSLGSVCAVLRRIATALEKLSERKP